MTGTVIITAANSSLAIPAVQHLLAKYPEYTAVLTVRNTADSDVNTKRLRATIAKHPNASVSIHQLDLASLSAVNEFANNIAEKIQQGSLPHLASLICNAYHWNLVGGIELTQDGYEKTFQVNHVAHAALVLRLLGSFGSEGGRVVLLSSDSHWPGKNSLEKYPPAIPDDLELLVKPVMDKTSDNMGYGFQRYAASKLAVVTWMYALNGYLKEEPKFRNITAVAINPGNLSDSRALRINTPKWLGLMYKFVLQPLGPVMRRMDPTLRTFADAGVDVVDLAVGKAHPQQRGYFTLLKPDASAPESLDKKKQEKVWEKTLQWTKTTL